MRHLFLFSGILFITTCGNTATPLILKPSCDTTGLSLKHKKKIINGAATNEGGEYYISISIDGQPLEVIADTGSSNLIVARNIGFKPTGTSSQPFVINYGEGSNTTQINLLSYTGEVDLNCIQPGVSNFIYGYITDYQSSKGNPEESILGLAYRDIAIGLPASEKTFFEQLSETGTISDEFSMLLCGANNNNSKITFGGTGSTSPESFQYVPITKQTYYVINAGSVKIGDKFIGTLNNTETIVDSGTTLNLVPQDIYNSIVNDSNINYQGDPGTEIDCPDTSGMPDITIALDNKVTLTITPETYFKKIGGGGCFFGFAPIGTGDTVILGQVTMENYHIRFDRRTSKEYPKGRIGFAANTACKN